MKKQAKTRTTQFGKKVKVRLIELDMTQVELAELLGVQKQYLTKILNGERSGKKYIQEIVRILGIEQAA